VCTKSLNKTTHVCKLFGTPPLCAKDPDQTDENY
jgi:hypothetical protein